MVAIRKVTQAKPAPLPPRRPLPFPVPRPLPPAAAEDEDADVLAAIDAYFQPEPPADPATLGIPGAFAAYWAELRRYGTHYLDLYGHVDDAYADGEDIAASAFLALVERSTDHATGNRYIESAQPAPARLLRHALYQLAKEALRAADAERLKRRPRWVTLLRIGDFSAEGGHTPVHPAAAPLVFPLPPRPAGSGWVEELEGVGVEALAYGSPARTALAVLAGQCPLAARVLILRYVSEVSPLDTARACGVTLKSLDGHLREARKQFAKIYGRMVGCGCPTWPSSDAAGETHRRMSVATRAALRALPQEG